MTINYKAKYNLQLQSIKDNYKAFDLPYNGEDNDDYVNGQGFCCNDGTPEAAQAKAMTRAAIDGNFKPNDEYEKMQFYYHPDHLGSSSYITNLDGEVSQHIEYVPFGEVFIEERNNTWNTPYLFNAKELDEETGMYYYGARYYEPRLSLWMSTDPLEEKYPNISSYIYCANNPINAIDLHGDSISIAYKTGFLGFGGTKKLLYEKGKLHNSDGSPYLGKVKGYLASVVQGLSDLGSTSEGASLISELETSTNMFTIKKGDTNKFKADSPTKAGGNLSEIQTVTGNFSKYSGSGGIIYWNNNITTSGLDTNGNLDRPSYIGLGHEMAHASDASQGLLHYSNDYTNTNGTYTASYNGLKKAEWRAVYRENIIRSQAQLPLRAYYGYDISSGKPHPIGPRLLSPQNTPLIYP